MSKFKKSQILVLTLLTALLFVTPLISTSSRPKYLYFVINILIIVLGAEAGLISSFSKPLEDRKVATCNTTKSMAPGHPEAKKQLAPSNDVNKKVKTVEKSQSEKIVAAQVVRVDRIKKCPSTPSLFFIGGGEANELEALEGVAENAKEDLEVVEAVEEVGDVSGQELFAKAETFIGNFYKQLKMQREESWKRIHGFYQKAF